jgi:biopolymer transport protein ExbD
MMRLRMTPPGRTRRAPDLTPVMDVVFILVVFFLVVSTFSETLVKPMQVSLPGSATSTASTANSAELKLTAQGMLLDRQPLAQADMTASLANLDGRPLVIVAGDDAPYQLLVDALDAAQAAGLSDVRVQAEREVGQ